MPRASGRDIAEIFGFAPDDTSDTARRQWKSQDCPFVGGTCLKHSHQQANTSVIVYGTCSVLNRSTRSDAEEVIICPQRLYADGYENLKSCVYDATGDRSLVLLAEEYSKLRKEGRLPETCWVMLGKTSGREVKLNKKDGVSLSIDWVFAKLTSQELVEILPCEVQSIDITGNYRATWEAYAKEADTIPDSGHGMNWANVWKRLVPQLILKGKLAASSTMAKHGIYFVVPDRVFVQFEKVVGSVPTVGAAGVGVLSVMTYELGDPVPKGGIRDLRGVRTCRFAVDEFARAFGSGNQLPGGAELEAKVISILDAL